MIDATANLSQLGRYVKAEYKATPKRKWGMEMSDSLKNTLSFIVYLPLIIVCLSEQYQGLINLYLDKLKRCYQQEQKVQLDFT